MKTLVMTTIFVVTVVINAFGGNIQENFAYNEVMNGNQVESQIVYKVENGKFLQNHLKYNFIYDAQTSTYGLLSRCVTSSISGCFRLR